MSTEPSAAVSSNAPLAATAPPRARATGFGGEWWVVFRHEFRRFLWSAWTLVAMGIYGGIAAGILKFFQWIEEKTPLKALNEALTPEQRQEAIAQALGQAGIANAGDVADYVRDHVPFTYIGFFLTASFFLPLLVAIVSFDQFSELSTRGARFVLLRVRRTTYFLGKAVAAMIAVVAFLLITWVIVAASTAARSPGEELPYVLKEAVRGWLLMSVTALPYLSLTAIVSAFTRPVWAFLLTFGTYVGLFIAWLIASALPGWLEGGALDALAAPARKLHLLFPWEHLAKLISRDTPTVMSGVIGLLLIAAAGYGAALYVVRRRDV